MSDACIGCVSLEMPKCRQQLFRSADLRRSHRSPPGRPAARAFVTCEASPLSRTLPLASVPKPHLPTLVAAMSAGYFIYAGFKPCLKVRPGLGQS